MTTSVRITATGVTNAFGLPLAVGTTQTLDDSFALSLVSQLKATLVSGTNAFPPNPPYVNVLDNAGSPVGVLTPQFIGQQCYDVTNAVMYTATGLTSADWSPSVGRANILAPSRPTNVLALAGNASANVQWSANHAGVPTSYTVTASPGGATTTVASSGYSNGSATVTGLTNGTPYTFTVVATNAKGASAASAASNSVTPTALPSSILPVTRGLEFWWSSAQATSPGNGNPLTSLVDFSGNGYNFAGQGTGSGGTWVSSWSGGKPAVALNGTNQYYHALATGYYAGMRGNTQTVYVLHDVQAQPAAIGYVLSAIRPDPLAGILNRAFGLGVKLGAAGTSDEILMDNTGDYFGSGSASANGTDIAWTTPIRAVVTMPGAMRVNGVAAAGLINPRLYAGAGNQPWCVGAMYGGGFNYYLQGRVAEVIIFNTVHTAAEIALMEAYLATRF